MSAKLIASQMANDGRGRIFDTYDDGRTVERRVTVHSVPSVLEQMGADPTSKLAAAINRLCDILERDTETTAKSP